MVWYLKSKIMNCPTCKNPLTTSTTHCEWCGGDLPGNYTDLGILFKANNQFRVLGRGFIYSGTFSGTLKIGDDIQINFNGVEIIGKVKAIQIDRSMVDQFSGNQEIGILI